MGRVRGPGDWREMGLVIWRGTLRVSASATHLRCGSHAVIVVDHVDISWLTAVVLVYIKPNWGCIPSFEKRECRYLNSLQPLKTCIIDYSLFHG